MGLNDTREQLEACKTQSVADERRIAELEERLAQIRATARLAANSIRVEANIADRPGQMIRLEAIAARLEAAQ